jgi:hypothetical protein
VPRRRAEAAASLRLPPPGRAPAAAARRGGGTRRVRPGRRRRRPGRPGHGACRGPRVPSRPGCRRGKSSTRPPARRRCSCSTPPPGHPFVASDHERDLSWAPKGTVGSAEQERRHCSSSPRPLTGGFDELARLFPGATKQRCSGCYLFVSRANVRWCCALWLRNKSVFISRTACTVSKFR